MEEMTKHGRIGLAAMRAGMDRKTARMYARDGTLASERVAPRDWRTHEDAFLEHWPELEAMLKESPARPVVLWAGAGLRPARVLMPHEHRPFEAALPSDFDQWPAPVRVVWRELLGSSAWRSAGWAHVTLRQLGEAVARTLDRPKCPHATVRRWLAWLTERGELARRCVRQGEALPDGSRAWCDHWIVLPGEAMKRA
jgi:hypothetical protein